MSTQLKFEGLFGVGQRIRANDYNPSEVDGIEVYLEGSIQALVSHPFKAYQILCDTSTSAERLVGKLVNIPMERETAEFDGRIVLSARN